MSTTPPRPDSPAALERIGRYRITRPLSKGGMALVYEARRESLAGVSPRVAIKLILPEFTASDTFQELFINEARLGASMQHQNLVQIEDFDRDGDRFFLVMEYVEGLTLRKAITMCRRRDVNILYQVIAEIGRQACDGLHYAHSARDEFGHHLRLVHRDVKPSNLILNPQGVVKVLDFGISKGRLLREKKGAIKGTWGYMAPEQASGLDVGPQADVFGLGIVLYEMAARRVLFEGKDKAAIKRLLLDDHAARMAATLDSVYGPMIPVLVRALQRDPKARYQNASDFGRALSALLPDPITARDEVVSFYKLVAALTDGVPLEQAARSASYPSTGAGVNPSQGSIAPTTGTTAGASVTAIGVVSLVALVSLVAVVLVGAVILVTSGSLRYGREPPVDDSRRVSDLISERPPIPAADEPAGPAGEDAPGEADPPPVASRTAPRDPRPPPSSTVPTPSSATAPDPFAAPVDDPPEDSVQVVVIRRTEPDPPPVVVDDPVGDPFAASGASTPGTSGDPGYVTIGAKPGGEVYIDGHYVRAVPVMSYELPPGTHDITIRCDDGRTKKFEITLDPGESERWNWDFDRGTWRK